MPGKVHAPRNYVLAGGIQRFSRSAMYAKKAVYKKKRVAVKAPKVADKRLKEKPVKGDKNGGKRIVLANKTVGCQYTYYFERVTKLNVFPSRDATILPRTFLPKSVTTGSSSPFIFARPSCPELSSFCWRESTRERESSS